MNDYSEAMNSDEASPLLKKFTEQAAASAHAESPPERFFEDFALLVRPPKDGWAVGLRINFTSDSWSIAEVLALPTGPGQTLPPLDAEDLKPYVDAVVETARTRQRSAAEQLGRLTAHADFIEERFESWRDKNAPRTNVEYAALAAKYAEQIRLGNSRATATLAGLVGMSPSVMAQRVKEARRRLLLTSGEQGRASGVLTALGVLYTEPEFPGMRALWRSGMRLRDISDMYGIPERLVWAGLEAERPEHGVSLSVEDFLPRAERER